MREGVCYCMICGKEWESVYDVKAHLYNVHEIETFIEASIGYREE